MVQNQTGQNHETLQPISLLEWRLNRAQAEKRVENVNREILHRQHAN